MENSKYKTLILPKPHLSWSQMSCWLSNPTRYRREYFENGEKLNTKYLSFGKNIATLIENGQHKTLLPDLACYDTPEFKIECKVKGVPILSFLDSYNKIETIDTPANVFREYKTGKVPWDRTRVQKHDQLTFYATALKWGVGKMPDYCDLDWIETSESSETATDFWREGDKIVHITGRILSFHREFDIREIERMEDLIEKIAWEISDSYQDYLKEI